MTKIQPCYILALLLACSSVLSAPIDAEVGLVPTARSINQPPEPAFLSVKGRAAEASADSRGNTSKMCFIRLLKCNFR